MGQEETSEQTKRFIPAAGPALSKVEGPLSLDGKEGEYTETAWWFVFRANKLLVHEEESTVRLPHLASLAKMGLAPVRWQYLGTLDGRHCYSAEVADDAEPPTGTTFEGVRQLYGRLDEDIFWLAGRASQLVNWDRTHQFCGRCGAPLTAKSDERAKVCHGCGQVAYHNPAPAVIVLIEREDRVLLARAWRHPPGLYSVIAGFVEPGESLEEAVVREIREEVGIEVRDIRYFGSQPWPFPNSLMIAFTCTYAAGEISLGESEILDAGWYGVESLPDIPPRISVARRLIDCFVDKRRQHESA